MSQLSEEGSSAGIRREAWLVDLCSRPPSYAQTLGRMTATAYVAVVLVDGLATRVFSLIRMTTDGSRDAGGCGHG